MKKPIFLLIAVLILSLSAYAQTASVRGVITDTASKENLYNTTVSLLRAKDSILYKFTRSDAKGNFELKGLDTGKYILLITYPLYADYVERLIIKDSAAM